MAATVLNIAGMIAVKRTPLDGDIDGIAGRVKLLGNAVYVAFPGSNLAAAVLGGVFFTSSDVSTSDPGGTGIPGPVIKAMGASPDGQGVLVQLDVDLRGLLEAFCLPLTELEIPLKSIGGTTAYARGSDLRIAKQPDDSMRHGLVLDLRVGAEGGTVTRPRCRNTPLSRPSPSLVQRRARSRNPSKSRSRRNSSWQLISSAPRLTPRSKEWMLTHGRSTSPPCPTSTH